MREHCSHVETDGIVAARPTTQGSVASSRPHTARRGRPRGLLPCHNADHRLQRNRVAHDGLYVIRTDTVSLCGERESLTSTLVRCADLGEEWGCDDVFSFDDVDSANSPHSESELDMREPAIIAATDCESGEGSACFELGIRLREGSGVRADSRAACDAFARGCALNHADSCEQHAVCEE